MGIISGQAGVHQYRGHQHEPQDMLYPLKHRVGNKQTILQWGIVVKLGLFDLFRETFRYNLGCLG